MLDKETRRKQEPHFGFIEISIEAFNPVLKDIFKYSYFVTKVKGLCT